MSDTRRLTDPRLRICGHFEDSDYTFGDGTASSSPFTWLGGFLGCLRCSRRGKERLALDVPATFGPTLVWVNFSGKLSYLLIDEIEACRWKLGFGFKGEIDDILWKVLETLSRSNELSESLELEIEAKSKNFKSFSNLFSASWWQWYNCWVHLNYPTS